MQTLITKRTVVDADGSFRADVLVEVELIAAVGQRGPVGVGQTLGALDQHPHRQDHRCRRDTRSSPAASIRALALDVPFGGAFVEGRLRARWRPAAFEQERPHPRLRMQTSCRPATGPRDLDGQAEKPYRHRLRFHMIMGDVDDATLKRSTGWSRTASPTSALHRLPQRLPLRRRRHLLGHATTAEDGQLILMHAENSVTIDIVANANAAAA